MVCAPTCDPGTLLGSSFARDVTLRPVAGNTVLSFGKCSLNWLNAKAVLTRLKRARHTWLLLVGDSDTGLQGAGGLWRSVVCSVVRRPRQG